MAWRNTPRKEGGIGAVRIPILSDLRDRYRKIKVCLERRILSTGMFIIDENGIHRQITMNDFPVGRSVEQTFETSPGFPVHRQIWRSVQLVGLLGMRLSYPVPLRNSNT